MTREEQLDWLCRLRSEIYVYMPKEWLIPMNNALDMAIKALEQEPTTKNDLGVDCISRADAIRVASGYCHPSNVAKELAKLPSVTPQEPKSEWEHDHEILKAYSDGASEVLDKIRAEIETKYGQCDICEYFEDYDYEENDISEYRAIGNIADILQIIDKYTAESAHDAAQEIVKNNGVVDL